MNVAEENLLIVWPEGADIHSGKAWFRGNVYPCALGAKGVKPAFLKREGDKASPIGLYAMMHLFWRADKITELHTNLPATQITNDMGWSDQHDATDYNQLVSLPYSGSAEKLWRDNDVYDGLIVISHNQSPVVPGHGSAIFIHIAREDFKATEGCVAFQRDDFLTLIKDFGPKTMIRIMDQRPKGL